MIGSLIALGLLAAAPDLPATAVVDGPVFTIDPCVEVEEATVRQVVDLELRGTRAGTLPRSVSVHCVDSGQEIRVTPSADEPDEVRTVQLVAIAEAAPPAARQARSRELALAIAELVRRRELAPPVPEPAKPPPLEPSVALAVTVSSTSAAEPAPGPWQLGILPSYDYFAGGQSFAGGDIVVACRLGRWLLAELRGGGRVGADQTVAGGSLSAHAATLGAAAGFVWWPERRPVGLAMMVRAQEYLVRFRTDVSGEPAAGSVVLGALVLAAEPRVLVAVTRHLALEGTGSIGLPAHGIVVRTQGNPAQSVSGVFVSASLGGVLRF